jgi:nucleoside-diphosphate-sugar epimerase
MHIFIPGGAGYVGSLLVPTLIEAGYSVTVYDLFLQGTKVFSALKNHPRLTLIKGDVRDLGLMEKALNGCETILHLACSLDSLELIPHQQKNESKKSKRFVDGAPVPYQQSCSKSLRSDFVSKVIAECDDNLSESCQTRASALEGKDESKTSKKFVDGALDAFNSFVQIAKRKVASRFIFTSSFAVYENSENHTEEITPHPLSPYAKFKIACEKTLMQNRNETLLCTILRPGIIFGCAPCMRKNNILNIFEEKDRFYPMVHIRDLISVYLQLLKMPAENLQGEIYNVGYHTLSLAEIRDRIKKNDKTSLPPIKEDLVSSKKIAEHLGFFPQFTTRDGIQELLELSEEESPPSLLLRN